MNVLIILVSVLLNCAAQICIRKGMLQTGEMTIIEMTSNIGTLVTNIWLWIAMFCYGISILLWMSILSKVQVSFAYPFLSVGYVISAIIGYFFFHESLSMIRVTGIVIICIGVILISRS